MQPLYQQTELGVQRDKVRRALACDAVLELISSEQLTPVKMSEQLFLNFLIHTMLFENLGSSGLADRLIAEKTLMMSMNALSGAESAKSTRLYAIAASTVGSAERSRCKSIDIVKRVTLCTVINLKNLYFNIEKHLPLPF